MRIVKLSAAILTALFLSATATAATVTQEGSGIGKDGEIKVKVVFEDGKIKNVDILKQQENPVLSQKVFTDLKDEIVKTDSADLDVIAGATYSSLGLLAAVKDAAQKAGITLKKVEKKAVKAQVAIPAERNYDVVVVGAGGAGFATFISNCVACLYFFVLLMLEQFFLLKVLNKAPAVVGHIYTLFFVVVSWAIFAIEDFAQLGAYLKVMFGLGGVPLVDAQLGYYVTSYLPILLVAAVASTPLGAKLYHKLKPRAAEVVCTVLVLAGLVVCPAYLVDGTYNPFLYFRF